MTKVVVPYPGKIFKEFYLDLGIDGVILGVENLSNNFNYYVSLNELEDIIKFLNEKKIEVFISLNKLYYEKDIEKLKKVLKIISKYDVSVMYNDISIYNLTKELKLDINLVWNSIHMATNYKTVNFWNKRGVKTSILSTEITKDEIIEIKNNTDSKIGIVLYGYLNMVTSSRKLISNYFKYIKLKKKEKKYLMTENLEDYPIIEENGETNIFSSKVLNGIEYFPLFIENNIDYVILDDYMLETKSFCNVVEAFSSLRNAPKDTEFVSKLYDVVGLNTNAKMFTGFLDKKTIFKVKNNE